MHTGAVVHYFIRNHQPSNISAEMKFYLVLALALAPLILAVGHVSAAGSDSLTAQPIIDGHNDFPTNLKELLENQLADFDFNSDLTADPKWNCSTCFTDIPRLKTGKVGAQFWVAYVGCNSQYKDAVEQTLDQIDVIKRLIRAYPDHLQYADSANGITSAIAAGKIASLISVEGGHSIDSRLGVLRLMYEAGARYLTLTHTCNTPWADGSPTDIDGAVAQHDGLTDWGKQVVKELNRLGMMVDLSHVSHKTMADALDVTTAPVIFSHSSAWAICNHHRNVQDDILTRVIANDGIVMVNFYSGFVNCDNTRKATIQDVAAHINHIRSIAGVEHVGIGADYDGVEEMPDGLEDVSKYPDLFDLLQSAEPFWTDFELQQLAGRNLLRVMRAVEKVRDDQAGVSAIEDLVPVEALGKNVGCYTDPRVAGDGASSVGPIAGLALAAIGILHFLN